MPETFPTRAYLIEEAESYLEGYENDEVSHRDAAVHGSTLASFLIDLAEEVNTHVQALTDLHKEMGGADLPPGEPLAFYVQALRTQFDATTK